MDVELPRGESGARRRVSRTVEGTIDDARAALEALKSVVAAEAATTKSTSSKKKTTSRRSSRARRSGGIFLLAPDRWLVGVEGDPDPVTGNRRRHTRTVSGSREQAEIVLARLKAAGTGELTQSATNARTVRAACELYLREASTERQTVRTDRSGCNRLCETALPGGGEFGDVMLSKVTWRMIEQVYAKWSGHLGPTTQSRYASTLSKVLDHAKRSGWLAVNPAREARSPKVPSHKPDVPKTAEVRDALARVRKADFETYAYVMGLATLGCRRSELLAIRVEDVDLDEMVVTIKATLADGGRGVGIYAKATKRDDWRDVPMTEQLQATLTELFELRESRLIELGRPGPRPNSFVFSDDPEGATWLRPDTMTHRWLKSRGDSPVTFAMIRRYVATQLLDATDGDYRTVASITGNSEETLRRWYDAGPNLQKKRAVVGLARL
ncbi:MAG: integrase family protein [Ilumatobacteraceae bacterium]|nr:integrase family protein [Ilumatobacteraceae bacterium]